MAKQLNAEKRFTQVSKKSNNAVVQFESTIETLESSNLELNILWTEVDDEIARLVELQDATRDRILRNTTTVQGLKNVLLGN